MVLDTNMYIFNYEYSRGIYNQYNLGEINKKKTASLIFNYLEDKQIPIVVPKIILDEIKKKMIELGYTYNKELIFGKLNIIEDKDETFEIENRPLAQKLFYESSTDLMIYIYCKTKEIQVIITDNTKDFIDSEKIYNKDINESKINITIAGIADTYKAISEKEVKTW